MHDQLMDLTINLLLVMFLCCLAVSFLFFFVIVACMIVGQIADLVGLGADRRRRWMALERLRAVDPSPGSVTEWVRTNGAASGIMDSHRLEAAGRGRSP